MFPRMLYTHGTVAHVCSTVHLLQLCQRWLTLAKGTRISGSAVLWHAAECERALKVLPPSANPGTEISQACKQMV